MTTIRDRRIAHDPGRDVRNAWLCTLLLPVVFALAFLFGEGTITALGYDLQGDRPPVWAMLTAFVPAVAVMAVPPVVGAWFARRAAAHGDRRGWVPAWILTGATVVFALQNILAALID